MQIKVKKVLQQYHFIEFALIFGSFASDKFTDLSDIDIGVYTKEPIDIFTQGEMIATLSDELEKRVDLVVLNDLYKNNARLSFNIVQNHKVVLSSCDKKYEQFKYNSLRYYFDMAYTYNMFNESLNKRLEDGSYGKIKAS